MTNEKLTRDEKISAHATPADYPALGVFGASPQVTDEQIGLAQFTEYFVKNYPGPDTIISRPEWHAPKIFAAAKRALLSAPPAAETPTWRARHEFPVPAGQNASIWRRNADDTAHVFGLPAAPQEAKPVAADGALIRFLGRIAFHETMPAGLRVEAKRLLDEAQEQAPADNYPLGYDHETISLRKDGRVEMRRGVTEVFESIEDFKNHFPNGTPKIPGKKATEMQMVKVLPAFNKDLIRNAALEEAAKRCEQEWAEFGDSDGVKCAAAIRALQSQPQQVTKHD